MNKELEQPKFIQKIFSSSRYVSIQLFGSGKSIYLYLGRGHGYEGCWQDKSPIPAKLRAKDQFLEYLRKHLSGGLMLSLELDDLDRILGINYQKFAQKNKLYLFWCARKLYVAHDYFEPTKKTFIRWLSWEGRVEWNGEDGMLEHFDKIGRTKLSSKPASGSEKSIQDLLKEEEVDILQSSEVKKKQKKKLLKIQNIKNDLIQIDQAIDYQKDLVNIDPSQLESMSEYRVGSLKHKFKPNQNFYQKRDDLFLWIKRLKVVRDKQKLRLLEMEKSLMDNSENSSEATDRKMISPIWKTPSLKKVENISVDNNKSYSIQNFESYKIGYGHDAKGNDQVRKEWASDNDMWVHLDGRKSSHAIIKSMDNKNCEISWIQEAAKILAKLSGITEGDINVIYTQVKHLKSVTGNPGMVNYKKEKRLRFII